MTKTKEEIQELIDNLRSNLNTLNNILVPGGRMSATALESLMDSMNNGYRDLLTDINDSMVNAESPINLATTDLSFDESRLVYVNGYDIGFTGIREMVFEATDFPGMLNPSFHFIGKGTTGGDVTHRFGSDYGTSFELYGDRNAKFTDHVGIGTPPVPGLSLVTAGSLRVLGAYLQMGQQLQFNGSGFSAILSGYTDVFGIQIQSTHFGIGKYGEVPTFSRSDHNIYTWKLQVGNTDLEQNNVYVDTRANIESNGDYFVAIKKI